MGLEKASTITQSKTAHTQYITIPATIVNDSQYPFRECGKVMVTVEPDYEIIIISREGVQLKDTQNGLLIKSSFRDLSGKLEVRHPSEKKN